MADASRRPAFEVVEDEPEATPAPKSDAGMAMLLLGLKTLSQRTLAAIAALFTLITVGSCFWLFFAIKQNPDTFQFVLAATYALFVLAANWIVRR